MEVSRPTVHDVEHVSLSRQLLLLIETRVVDLIATNYPVHVLLPRRAPLDADGCRVDSLYLHPARLPRNWNIVSMNRVSSVVVQTTAPSVNLTKPLLAAPQIRQQGPNNEFHNPSPCLTLTLRDFPFSSPFRVLCLFSKQSTGLY